MITGLLALALVIGPGWQPCVASHQTGSLVAATEAKPASHHDHADHRHSPDHTGVAQPPHKSGDTGDNAACQKCCAACIPASILPRDAVVWTPEGSRATFVSPSERSAGQIVLVDPDIPKTPV